MERLCPNFRMCRLVWICPHSDRVGLLTVEGLDRTGDCSFGYIGTTLTDTYLWVHQAERTTSGHINGVLLDTNLSSVLLRDPTHIITSEWVAIGGGILEMLMSAGGDSGGLLTDDRNAIVGMIIRGLPRQYRSMRISGWWITSQSSNLQRNCSSG